MSMSKMRLRPWERKPTSLEQLTQRHAQAERDLLHEVDGGVAVARLHLGEVRPSYTRHERKLLLRQIALLAKRPDALSDVFFSLRES